MTDDTLLLRLRAETLQANLVRLKDHLATPDRMEDLEEVGKTAKAALRSINTADTARANLGHKIDRGEKIGWEEKTYEEEPGEVENPTTVANTFESLRKDLDQARTSLRALQGSIEQMRIKCFRLAETPVGSEIVENLRSSTKPLIAELLNIQAIENGQNNVAGGWQTLQEKITATEPIFTDYMELLGAAALRDTGFDEKISHFADEILRSTGGKLLALPVRREALLRTFKQIIRVTFPDWTVWALPSAALEFWNVVGRQRVEPTLDANLANLPPAEKALLQEEHRRCLGDAYATYIMGPSYAYYAVGLLLALDSEQEQCRVRAILQMLECMEEGPLSTRYVNVRRQLLTAWNGARVQLGQAPLELNIDDPREAANTDPAGAGVRLLIRRFWNTLEFETSAKFGVAIWNESQPWVELLLQDKVDQINVPNGVELRHLLNAAWLARVDPERNPRNDLNAAVKTLQDKIKERQEKKGK